ncbi:MAG: hypothetical protein J6A68_04185 [Oscillospiraceae bacterium]|nr:hypothetical protein [Oscillospiraceae bacterium]
MKYLSTLKFGIKQMLRYLLISFFSLILIFSLSFFITNFAAQLVLFVCCTGISWMLTYQFAWDQGNHDANYVARGMIKSNENRGLVAGLIGITFPIIAYLLGLFAKLELLPEAFFKLQNMLNPPSYAYIGWLFASVKEVVMEGDITQKAWMMCSVAEAPWWGFALQPIPTLILPFISWFAYKLGRKQILLSDRILYRSSKDRAKKEQARIQKENKRIY